MMLIDRDLIHKAVASDEDIKRARLSGQPFSFEEDGACVRGYFYDGKYYVTCVTCGRDENALRTRRKYNRSIQTILVPYKPTHVVGFFVLMGGSGRV